MGRKENRLPEEERSVSPHHVGSANVQDLFGPLLASIGHKYYNSSSDAGRYPTFVLDFRRAAARSQALAAASTGVWTDFSPIFAVRLKHCVCPRPLQVLHGTSVAVFESDDSQSHRAREGGQDCNTMCSRYACFVWGKLMMVRVAAAWQAGG